MRRVIRESNLRKLTLSASLAGVYVIFRSIPISSLIGISGSVTAAGMIAPVVGILLEPSYGIASVFIGTLVASLFPWNPLKFYGLDFLPGALNVTLVSLAVRGRRTEATIMFLVTLGLFIINPNTALFVGSSFFSPPIPYLWMHLAALVVLISPLAKNLGPSIISHQFTRLAIPISILAFTGTMIEHATGGLLFATVVGKGALKFWPAIFVAYPAERVILVIGATLISTTLLRLLKPSMLVESLEAGTRVQTTASSLAETDPLSMRN